MAESSPWDSFLGSLNVYKFGLSFYRSGMHLQAEKNIENDKEDLLMSSLIFHHKASNWV